MHEPFQRSAGLRGLRSEDCIVASVAERSITHLSKGHDMGPWIWDPDLNPVYSINEERYMEQPQENEMGSHIKPMEIPPLAHNRPLAQLHGLRSCFKLRRKADELQHGALRLYGALRGSTMSA